MTHPRRPQPQPRPLTLAQVKDRMNIDFSDYDDLLIQMMAEETAEAERTSGRGAKEFTAEVWGAVARGVAERFDNRSSSDHTVSESVRAVYRRFSKRPMF